MQSDPTPEIIYKYFPDLTTAQKKQIQMLFPLYKEWNEKINVVSRKDIDSLYEKHVLHSLSIAKFFNFLPGSKILDVGTGGGFPGIPLAIFFPEVQFHLVDSIGKKITVVREVANAVALTNVKADHVRAEQVEDKFDFVVSRAVAPLAEVFGWVRNSFSKEFRHQIPNGLICLKGGDLTEEIKASRKPVEVIDLKETFSEEFFETKKITYLKLSANQIK